MDSTATIERPAGLDVVKALEARGAELVGVLNAATAGLVSVIADALVCEAWQGYGINSPEHWVALRFGMGPRRARRLVAAARALSVLPACRAAFAAGELSEDHVAAIVNAQVQPRNDAEATELARHATVTQLRRGLTGLPPDPANDDKGKSGSDSPKPRAQPASYVTRTWRDDGMWDLHAVLSASDGAIVDKAINAALDKLFRQRHGDDADSALRSRISSTDALLHVANVALDAMDPATATHRDRRPSSRYVVDIHLDAANPDSPRIHLGPALPRWGVEEIMCDGLVRTWVATLDGNVNLGPTRRTVDARLRLLVEHRDGGCCIAGCSATRGLTIHHIRHWIHGGPTDADNLVALCPAHHRVVHTGEIIIQGTANGGLIVTDRLGRPIGHQPPRPPTKPPPEAASDLGLPPPRWRNRLGERAMWDCMVWTDPPPTDDG